MWRTKLEFYRKILTIIQNKVKFDPENKPGVSNLMQIYSAITGKTMEEIEAEFEGRGYGDFKITVANSVIDKLKPIQDRYKEILEDKEYLEEIYTKGAENARRLASKTLENVKNKIGIL